MYYHSLFHPLYLISLTAIIIDIYIISLIICESERVVRSKCCERENTYVWCIRCLLCLWVCAVISSWRTLYYYEVFWGKTRKNNNKKWKNGKHLTSCLFIVEIVFRLRFVKYLTVKMSRAEKSRKLVKKIIEYGVSWNPLLTCYPDILWTMSLFVLTLEPLALLTWNLPSQDLIEWAQK